VPEKKKKKKKDAKEKYKHVERRFHTGFWESAIKTNKWKT